MGYEGRREFSCGYIWVTTIDGGLRMLMMGFDSSPESSCLSCRGPLKRQGCCLDRLPIPSGAGFLSKVIRKPVSRVHREQGRLVAE